MPSHYTSIYTLSSILKPDWNDATILSHYTLPQPHTWSVSSSCSATANYSTFHIT